MASVSEIISNHLTLKHQLMDILSHQDSRWGPADFDIPPLSPLQPAPLFLQPVHQPQMRLPSMSSLWGPNGTVSANQMQLISQEEDNFHAPPMREESQRSTAEYEQWQDSSYMATRPCTESTPIRVEEFLQRASPRVGHAIVHSSPSVPTRCGFLQQSPEDGKESVQDPTFADMWHGTDHGSIWAGHRQDQQQELQQAFVNRQYSPTAHDAAHSVGGCLLPSPIFANEYHPHQEQDFAQPEISRACGSEAHSLETPFALHTSQNILENSVSSRKRSRNISVATIKTNDLPQDQGPAECDPRDMSPNGMGTIKKRSSGDLPFIHGLCGKAFVARSKVKKHHWGGKINNLNTTTGCWAKHNKPSAAWDDHPSCKEASRNTTKNKQNNGLSAPSEKEGPVAPSMVSGRLTSLPSLSTLGYMSQHIADAPDPLQEPPRFAQDAPASFLSHYLPPTSPFETLLTAVNVASKIEAPVAQGRNHSVVNQLDAQALAAERTGQHLPAWAPHQYEEHNLHQQHFQPTQITYGQSFGTSPVHTLMWMAPSPLHADPGNSYVSSIVSPIEPTFGDPRAVAVGQDMEHTGDLHQQIYQPHEWESPTTSLSPGPSKKRSCVA